MSVFDPQSVMIRDVFPLQRLLSKNAGAVDKKRGLERLAESQQRLHNRAALLPPKIKFPDELPITGHLEKISRLLHSNQVVIVAGETGSGKTTQLPKLCLKAGYGVRGKIGHTQPRRIAARAVSQRIAEELDTKSSELVGYSVRFADTSTANSLIKVATDGLLLTEIRNDRYLTQYEVIIIDEAHERSLNIDFLLGYLKQLLPKRPDLKIIVTSATIDVDAFSSYFNKAPVVSVSGRGYPVEEVYLGEAPDQDLGMRILECLADIESRTRKMGNTATDVLVFLTGEREIFEVAKSLRDSFRRADKRLAAYTVLPLYARLSASEQHKVFNKGQQRRVILATNVAETSITVPNIGFVIDPGQVRISRYSYRTKLQRLPIEAVSQASANQRKGRCGRIAAGVCYRLYSEEDFEQRPEFTDPEILRTSLASVVLQMRAFRLGEEYSFPFLDMPQQSVIRDAVTALAELGALKDNKLTKTGGLMARLPIDPRLAKILLVAHANNCLAEVLVIVSALALQDPRERPLEKQQAADQAHAIFRDEKSDFNAYLNIWRWSETQRTALTRKAYSARLKKQYLSAVRMREWRDLHRQLLLICKANKMPVAHDEALSASFKSVHRSLLPGFLGQLGLKDERGIYIGARQLKFSIFPGSVLFKRQPKWLMCAEIAETGRVYGRCAAQIDITWVEQCAKHLLKPSYSEPHWSIKREEVQAYQSMTLYGLPVIERRLISLGAEMARFGGASTPAKLPGNLAVTAAGLRQLFISEGLVRGGASTRNRKFLAHNLDLVREVLAKEDTYRRRDLLLHDDHLIAFYDGRIPAKIVDMRGLDRWRRSVELEQAEVLYMSMDDVLSSTDLPSESMFPPDLEIGNGIFALKYKFAPGEIDDGVSMQVKAEDLEQLSRARLEWLVPGLVMAKCEQMIRNLPKQIRRKLVPVPQLVQELETVLLREQCYGKGSLPARLSELIAGFRSVNVDSNMWNNNKLSDNYIFNIQVRGPKNRLVSQGRDIDTLLARITRSSPPEGEVQELAPRTVLEFPDKGIQSNALVSAKTGHLLGYPALQDNLDSVALVKVASRHRQSQLNRAGYARLALLYERKASSFLRRSMSGSSEMALHYASLGSKETLQEQILLASAWYCFFEDRPLPTEKEAFESCLREHRGELGNTCNKVLELTGQVLTKRFQLVSSLLDMQSPAFQTTVSDIRKHLEDLVGATFLASTSSTMLAEIPRYVEADTYRLQHLQGRVEKDEQSTIVITALDERLQNIRKLRPEDTEIHLLRRALEELRVMLFAQSLGARGKVSVPKVEKMLARLEASIDS